MAQCKRCHQPIRWQKEGTRFIALNATDGSVHTSTCPAPAICRNCERPVVWKEHDGKRRCFDPDGSTLHNDVCLNRDQCSHCRAPVRWVSVEGKWLAFDCTVPEMLHWSVCLKNPDAARLSTRHVAELTRELHTLRQEVSRLRREMAANEAHYRREINYRDVELARLTRKIGP